MPLKNDDRPCAHALLESASIPLVVTADEPRAVVFFQGDTCDRLMRIEHGRVRLAVTTPGGKEAICGFLDTGAFLREEALNGHAVRRQAATVMIETELHLVAKAQMPRLLRRQPTIADRLISPTVATRPLKEI